MNNSMIFENKNVEIFEINKQVLFNPYDVGDCLNINNVTVRRHMQCFSEKQVVKLKNSDIRNMNIRKLNNAGENFLTESGVYKLIFKSQKKEAEKFQDWVTDVVLPDIRKHGMYATENTVENMLGNPDLMIELLTNYKKEKEERKKLELENEKKNELLIIAGEKTSFVDDFLATDDLYSIDAVSKILAIKGLGRNNLYKYLRDNKIIMSDMYRGKGGLKHFTAFATYTNTQQYFKHRTRDVQIGDRIVKQNIAMFTSNGINWIYKRLIKDGYVVKKDLETIIEELKNTYDVA